ncbi:unnamed protein product, partial [Heterotrigona itama]
MVKLRAQAVSKKRVCINKKWQRIIFIDEKRFNLNEPDGLHYCYHDLRKEQQFLSRRTACCSDIMIGGCIDHFDIKITRICQNRGIIKIISEIKTASTIRITK